MKPNTTPRKTPQTANRLLKIIAASVALASLATLTPAALVATEELGANVKKMLDALKPGPEQKYRTDKNRTVQQSRYFSDTLDWMKGFENMLGNTLTPMLAFVPKNQDLLKRVADMQQRVQAAREKAQIPDNLADAKRKFDNHKLGGTRPTGYAPKDIADENILYKNYRELTNKYRPVFEKSALQVRSDLENCYDIVASKVAPAVTAALKSNPAPELSKLVEVFKDWAAQPTPFVRPKMRMGALQPTAAPKKLRKELTPLEQNAQKLSEAWDLLCNYQDSCAQYATNVANWHTLPDKHRAFFNKYGKELEKNYVPNFARMRDESRTRGEACLAALKKANEAMAPVKEAMAEMNANLTTESLTAAKQALETSMPIAYKNLGAIATQGKAVEQMHETISDVVIVMRKHTVIDADDYKRFTSTWPRWQFRAQPTEDKPARPLLDLQFSSNLVDESIQKRYDQQGQE